jgi:hypothetical protein
MTGYKDKLKYITPPDITKCIFCGDPPPLTGEHVFPRWSHKYLPPTAETKHESLRGIRNPHESKHYSVTRSGDIRHWKVICVCHARCNNGWMRTQIEETAKPILVPLIKGGIMPNFSGRPNANCRLGGLKGDGCRVDDPWARHHPSHASQIPYATPSAT